MGGYPDRPNSDPDRLEPGDGEARNSNLVTAITTGVRGLFIRRSTESRFDLVKLPRSTEKLAIPEVSRKHELMSVGDLHGNWKTYEGNLNALRVVDADLNWLGGNSVLVFL